MTVQDMITKIRVTTHDQQNVGYSDTDLLGYINDGYRIFRRLIMDNAPMLLAEEKKGTLAAGVSPIQCDTDISKVITVMLDKESIPLVSYHDIDYTDITGIPYCCYLVGFRNLYFFPTDNTEHEYSIYYVPDMKLLELNSKSPFPTDITDLLYEYAIVRASISNEFDMSQENNVLSTILGQVESYVRNLTPMGVYQNPYWDNGYIVDDGTWNHNYMYRRKW